MAKVTDLRIKHGTEDVNAFASIFWQLIYEPFYLQNQKTQENQVTTRRD
jgi:hypothetical protein